MECEYESTDDDRSLRYESKLVTNGSTIDDSSTVLEGCPGVIFPKAQPAIINSPPNIPVGVRNSPKVTKAKPAPQSDVVVIKSVSSDADTTLRATVSKYYDESEVQSEKIRIISSP